MKSPSPGLQDPLFYRATPLSEASCIVGDANADDTLAEFNTMPELVWESGTDGFSDGDWAQEADTHGDGVDEEELQHHGQFGVMAGNWGTCYESHRAHNSFDVKSSAAAFVMAQEATQHLLDHLRAPGTEEDAIECERTHGGGVKWQVRPTFQFYGFRGPEEGPSVLICARKSLVLGMRLFYFKLRNDGPYTTQPKKDQRRPTEREGAQDGEE